jgi:phosphoglycolate phosphatase
MSEPSKPSTLVIMDVDGTMLTNGTALREPFYQAFLEVTGENIRGKRVNFAGNTDRGIIREYLQLTGVQGDFETLFCAFAERFCELVAADYPTHSSPRLLPGALELLDALHVHPEAALVLGTGNIRACCETKLQRFDLLKYFPHGGGFGGDHEIRSDAIAAAMEAGRSGYGWFGEAWVVGDTMNDALAGHQAGAKVLLTATGTVSLDDLLTTEAEAILPDLTETDHILEIFGLS